MICPRCEQDIDLGHSGCRDPACPANRVGRRATDENSDILAFVDWMMKLGSEFDTKRRVDLARAAFIAGWRAGNAYAFEGVDE